jgi:hypothetical protein
MTTFLQLFTLALAIACPTLAAANCAALLFIALMLLH